MPGRPDTQCGCPRPPVAGGGVADAAAAVWHRFFFFFLLCFVAVFSYPRAHTPPTHTTQRCTHAHTRARAFCLFFCLPNVSLFRHGPPSSPPFFPFFCKMKKACAAQPPPPLSLCVSLCLDRGIRLQSVSATKKQRARLQTTNEKNCQQKRCCCVSRLFSHLCSRANLAWVLCGAAKGVGRLREQSQTSLLRVEKKRSQREGSDVACTREPGGACASVCKAATQRGTKNGSNFLSWKSPRHRVGDRRHPRAAGRGGRLRGARRRGGQRQRGPGGGGSGRHVCDAGVRPAARRGGEQRRALRALPPPPPWRQPPR